MSEGSKLNANAASFSFNPTASTWTPPSAPVTLPNAQENRNDIADQVSNLDIKQDAENEQVDENDTEHVQVDEGNEQDADQIDAQNVQADDNEPKQEQDEENDTELEEDENEEEEVGDEDPRQHVNLVFIGHVDAGKSTLSGNILYLMDMVDKRTIERYEREAKEVRLWCLYFYV